MGDYRLIRVGISPDFLRLLSKEECESEQAYRKKQSCFWSRFRGRKNRKIMRKEKSDAVRMRTLFFEELEADRDCSRFFCAEPIPALDGWIFNGYLEDEWILHMMRYASLCHYVILGRANCLPQILVKYVGRMKSLKWVLLSRQFKDAEKELLEELFEQFGLAVKTELLEGEDGYRKIRHESRFPSVVLDFSEEDKVSVAGLEKGSIWVDMSASDRKRERIEARNTGILYFSLKKEWQEPEKARYQLDTTVKNGYNT